MLGSSVLQTVAEISSRDAPDTQLWHYKLQTLLHLELLWVLGEGSQILVIGNCCLFVSCYYISLISVGQFCISFLKLS